MVCSETGAGCPWDVDARSKMFFESPDQEANAEMQIHPLAQEVPKPGLPEAAGAPVGCSTFQVWC